MVPQFEDEAYEFEDKVNNLTVVVERVMSQS
jgi:hypothetical protein